MTKDICKCPGEHNEETHGTMCPIYLEQHPDDAAAQVHAIKMGIKSSPGALHMVNAARNLWIEGWRCLTEDDKKGALEQLLIDAMDIVEQTDLEGAIIAARGAMILHIKHSRAAL
jgi:hypothetical protein